MLELESGRFEEQRVLRIDELVRDRVLPLAVAHSEHRMVLDTPSMNEHPATNIPQLIAAPSDAPPYYLKLSVFL